MTLDPIALRPRGTGEILDDAWRLARSEGVSLLVLSSLFQVPAFCALLWMLTLPSSASLLERVILPFVTAALLTLTGLGSGACQELLRRRAEGQAVRLTSCLIAALRRSVGHLTARAVALVGIVSGLLFLVMPGLTIWIAASTVHVSLAHTATGSLREVRLGHEARFDAVKSAVVVLSRIPILALAMLNGALLAQLCLWVLGNFAGFDVALLAVQLSWDNPLFLTSLGLFCWTLLAPYFEASNFLLHLDTRVRQEGLDLRYRVERIFPTAGARHGAVVAGMLALLVWLPVPAHAQEALDTVRQARVELSQVRDEVKTSAPYPGGVRWVGRLETLTNRVEDLGAKRFRWLRKGLDGFSQRDQASAVRVLNDMEQRLLAVEESLTPSGQPPGPGRDDIKGLLRPRDNSGKPAKTQRDVVKQPERRPRQKDENKAEPERAPRGEVAVRRGDGLIQPGSVNVGSMFWPIMAGLVLAVIVTALVLWLRRREQPARPAVQAAAVSVQPLPPAPHEQAPTALFRQAEELARAGRFKEASRSLYHAILSLLHRQQLLRYEITRTNGEYVRQVRLAPTAPPGLHEPFARLTSLFDDLWYGDRDCGAGDYSRCRKVAEEVRQAAA